MGKFVIHNQVRFGAWGRYMLKDCTGRFGTKVWMVTDAETPDPTRRGEPDVIRQSETREDALKGLE